MWAQVVHPRLAVYGRELPGTLRTEVQQLHPSEPRDIRSNCIYINRLGVPTKCSNFQLFGKSVSWIQLVVLYVFYGWLCWFPLNIASGPGEWNNSGHQHQLYIEVVFRDAHIWVQDWSSKYASFSKDVLSRFDSHCSWRNMGPWTATGFCVWLFPTFPELVGNALRSLWFQCCHWVGTICLFYLLLYGWHQWRCIHKWVSDFFQLISPCFWGYPLQVVYAALYFTKSETSLCL